MNKKKLLALLMALVMTLSLLPMTVFADEINTQIGDSFAVTFRPNNGSDPWTVNVTASASDEFGPYGTLTKPSLAEYSENGIRYVFDKWVSGNDSADFFGGATQANIYGDETLNAMWTAYLAEGYELIIPGNGTFESVRDYQTELNTLKNGNTAAYVQKIEETVILRAVADPVAMVGEVEYASLAEAAKNAGDNATITMVADSIETEAVIFTSNNVTLDLKGKTVTANKYLWIKSGSLTVKGSSGSKIVNPTEDSVAIYVGPGNGTDSAAFTLDSMSVTIEGTSWGIVPLSNATVTIKNGTVRSGSEGYAISGNGNNTNTTININGGKVIGGELGVYFPCGGTLNITKGDISGKTGVYIKSGALNISGTPTIKGTGEAFDYTYWGNGGHATGDALVIDNCAYPSGNTNPISITGGTFTSNNAHGVYCYSSKDQTVSEKFITAGIFNGEAPDNSYLASGSMVLKTGKTKWTVIRTEDESKYAVEVRTSDGDVYLSKNLSSTNGVTNKLIGDLTGQFTNGVVATGNVVIDLNGYTLTNINSNSGAIHVRGSQTVTVKNGTIISASDGVWVYSATAKVIVDGVKITADGAEALYAQNGTIEVLGGEFQVTGENKNFVANLKDDNGKAGTAKIIVYGGKFHDYDPSNTTSENPAVSFVADGYTVTNEGNVYTVGRHEHTYGEPTWSWRKISGKWAAVASFTCVDGDDTQYVRATIDEQSEVSEITSTATVTFGGIEYQDSHTVDRIYTVSYNGRNSTHTWGSLVTLRAEDNISKKWLINGKPVADGRSYYTFAVTEDSVVSTEWTEEHTPVAVISATMTAENSNSAILNVKWSLPENATVKSVTIYRAWNRGGRVLGAVNENEMKSKAAYNVDLLVRNGDFTFTITGLGADRYPGDAYYQNAQMWIEYTVPGNDEVFELASPIGTGTSQVQVW